MNLNDDCQQKNEARAMEGSKGMNMKRQKKMEITFESFWKNNKKLNNILNGVNNGIMDKISIGEFAQLCFKEGFNAGCWSCDDRWIDCEKSNPNN